MKDNTVSSCFGLVFMILILVVVGMFTNGWALSTIWNWFMPNIFHITPLTLWQAVGVSTVFGLFTGKSKIQSSTKSPDKSLTDVFIEGIVDVTVVPLFTVFMSWIVYSLAF